MKTTYYSNGKLLLTGEYLVLDGAKALALPTKMGQNLIVTPKKETTISWQSHDADGSIWFKDEFAIEDIHNYSPTDEASIKNTLLRIIHEAHRLQSTTFDGTQGYEVITQLTFPRNWGLGTSSTLINNIGQWLQIDAFELLKNSFGGSGYDIACAQNNSPIFYQINQQEIVVEPIQFDPEFSQKLYFVYLNKKQNSAKAIASYFNTKHQNLKQNIEAINRITDKVSKADDLVTFAQALHEHEIILSNILELSTIQENLFPDFDGVIKSLGAWGGDFVLAVAKENPKDYFTSKGFNTVIPYKDMIL